jgi:hypothetical protein
MSGASTQVRAAGQQAAAVARWLDHCGEQHADAGRATRSTLSDLGASWRSPHADTAVGRGGEVADILGRVGGPLGSGARALGQLAQQSEQLTRLLQALEQREAELQRQLSLLTTTPDDTAAAAESASRRRTLLEQLRDVERRTAEALESWRGHQATAAVQLEEAAAWVRRQIPAADVRRLFDRLEEWYGRIGTVVEGVAEGIDRVVEGLQAWAVVARRTVVTRVRQVQLIVHGQAVRTWRQVQTFATTTYTIFRQQVPRWLARLQGMLARVTPALRWGGRVLGGVGATLSGYDRFQRDADRPDTTSTERWLRAGIEAGVRGVPMALAGAASKALIGGSVAAAAGSFGLGAFLVPAAIAASGGLLYGADKLGDRASRIVLDEWEWSQNRIRQAADALDAGGRSLRDGYRAVTEGVGTVVDQAVDGAGAARDWAAERVTSAREGIDSLVGSVSERVEQVGWRNLLPRPGPVILPLTGGGWPW